MATYEVDPISRIEGHLGVKITESGNVVTEADVHGNLWRGFENFLLGRDVNDAITFTQRICGVCPVPHGLTSTYAVDSVLGYSRSHITFQNGGGYGVPLKAVYLRNLVLSAEFLMSHLTHFYHLVVLDYVQGPATPPWTPFFNDNFYATALQNPTGSKVLPTQTEGFSDSVWDAGVTQYVKALRIRRLTFEAGALFAGRMPMTSCFVGGGVTNAGTENLAARVANYKTIIREVGEFIIKEHVPLVLALGALYLPYDNTANGGDGYGGGYGNFLAWGAFPQADDTLALPGGVFITTDKASTGNTGMLFQVLNKADVYNKFLGDDGSGNDVPSNLTESIASSHYDVSEFDTANYTATAAYPGVVQRTMPLRSNGYSYIKSPRWDGQPCEVGPFARMVVAGLYSTTGGFLRDGFGAYYTEYVKTVNGVTGLDPKMIAADLAVALVRDSLATLTLWDGTTTTVVDAAVLATLDNATIGAAYAGTSAFGDPVITGTVAGWVYGLKGGLSVMDRIRARALEALYLVQKMVGTYDKDTGFGADGWIDDACLLDTTAGSTWRSLPAPTAAVSGKWGATEAPRGALAHFASINAHGKITAYQCVVPTTWNASPKDGNGYRGAMEESMIGIPYSADLSSFVDQSGNTQSTQSGLEALRVAHTFDPCIACAVH